LIADKKQNLVNAGRALSGNVSNYLGLCPGAVEAGSVKSCEVRVELRTHDASQKQKYNQAKLRAPTLAENRRCFFISKRIRY
jgi:hypothetical protein